MIKFNVMIACCNNISHENIVKLSYCVSRVDIYYRVSVALSYITSHADPLYTNS